MKLLYLLTLASCLGGCSALRVEQSGFRVTSLSQGLMRADGSGAPEIYRVGEQFTYHPNGTCVAVGQKIDCMWHGFSLGYEARDDSTELSCISESSQSLDYVNPTEHHGNMPKRAWTLTLSGKTGRFTNPQYIRLRPGTELTSSTRCSFQGTEVFRSEFLFTAPLPPASVSQRSGA